MRDEQRLIPAPTFLAWWQALAERLAGEPTDKGTGTLLWQLDVIGRANEATRLSVARGGTDTTSPGYVLSSLPDPDFDWENGVVDFVHPGYLTVEPDVLIHDLVKVTGIAAPERSTR